MNALLQRAIDEQIAPVSDDKLCQGTLLSRAQYLPDIERWGYKDVRNEERCKMSAADIGIWTNAISQSEPPK
jgi:hypothetical protein